MAGQFIQVGDQVEKFLQAKFGTENKLQNCSIQNIGAGVGFLSHMLRVELTWAEAEPQLLPTSVVAKIPTYDVIEQVHLNSPIMETAVVFAKGHLQELHNCEVGVYRLFNAPNLNPPIPLAKLYGSEEMGPDCNAVILMEDLSEVGRTKDMTEGLSFEQLKQVVDKVASLHAWSLKTDVWKQPSLNMPSFLEISWSGMEEGLSQLLEIIKKPRWVRALGQDLVDGARKIKITEEEFKNYTKMHRDFGLPDVFVHGDFWNSNILWSRKCPDEILAIVDWQFCHSGSPAEDLCRLMTFSVHAEVREKHLDDLLSYYYQALTSHLGTNPPFDFGSFLKVFESQFLTKLKMIAPIMPGFADAIEGGELNLFGDTQKGGQRIAENLKSMLKTALKLSDKL